jgi:hypothetical protein
VKDKDIQEWVSPKSEENKQETSGSHAAATPTRRLLEKGWHSVPNNIITISPTPPSCSSSSSDTHSSNL